MSKIVPRAAGGGRKSKDALVGVGDADLKRLAPPKTLIDQVAIDMWKTQSAQMIKRGTLALEFAPLLLNYCNAFSLLLKAEKLIAEEGLIAFSDQGGAKKHPAVNVRNDSVAQMARLGSLLGLDPLSCSRMTGAGGSGESEDENEFNEF